MSLEGKNIISTRPVSAVQSFVKALNSLGANVHHLPMIEIAEQKLSVNDFDVIDDLRNYNWIVFQSANAVKHFFSQLPDSQIKNFNSFIKVASIGGRTTEELKAFDIQTDFENPGNNGDDFAESLKNIISPNDYIFIPSGDIARRIISEVLPNRIDYITVYRNLKPETHNEEVLNLIKTGKYDILTFASPSGIINLRNTLNDDTVFNKLKAVCIGNITAGELKNNGVEPLAVAEKANSDGLVNAIVEYYK